MFEIETTRVHVEVHDALNNDYIYIYMFLSSPFCFRLMQTLLDESSTQHWWESKVIGHGSANACVWLQASDQNAFVTFVLEMWLSACVFFLWG